MPNWCTNQLIICGPATWIGIFKEKITNEDGSLNILDNLYPVPEDLKGLVSMAGTIPDNDPSKEQKLANVEKYGAADWYDWSIKNWGTKWSDVETRLCEESDLLDDGLKSLMYSFDTAWGPPQEGIEHISKSFKPLLFDLRYQEPGMMFCGYARYINGEVVEEKVTDLVIDAEQIYHCIEWDYEYDMKRGLDEADVK